MASESLKLDKKRRIYDQNTVGESRWTLLSRRYKMDFALLIFLWIFYISNCLLFFFHKCWVNRDQSPLFFHHLMFYCRQVLGFCRSLEEEGQCMHEWLLKNFLSICKWIEHIKKWRDWCTNHTNSNFFEVKSHCYMPRILFRHLSY